MKSATVAFGLFAGMASASYNHPRHFHNPHWRRNETAAASTTLTVAVTSVHTITSCAPTITNCPANSGNSTGPAVVTEVIDLTTTVCPVTAAESISSSMVGAHSSGLIPGSTRTITATPTSGASSPQGTASGNAAVSVYPSVGTVDQTVTMTLGPESSRSILVTTLKSTLTEMVTVTAVPVASASGNSGNTGSGSGSEGAVTSQEATTTTTMTSTGTRTVTIVPAESSGVSSEETGSGNNSGNSGSSDSGSGSGSGNSSGECVASTVTVTETQTVPASTVYVTAPAAAEATGVKAVTSETASTPSAGSSDESGESDSASVVTAIATATVVPYPAGNGTAPVHPSGTAIPTVVLRH